MSTGTCNDFSCTCGVGYSGKKCEQQETCVCAFGIAPIVADGPACPENGAERCSSCRTQTLELYQVDEDDPNNFYCRPRCASNEYRNSDGVCIVIATVITIAANDLAVAEGWNDDFNDKTSDSFLALEAKLESQFSSFIDGMRGFKV